MKLLLFLLLFLLVISNLTCQVKFETLIDSAEFAEKQNKYKRAISWSEKALKSAKKNKDTYQLMLAEEHLGSAHYSDLNYATSGSHYFNALELAKRLRNKKAEADYYNSIGCVYYAQNDIKKAKEYFSQSVALANKEEKKRSLHGSNYSYLAGIFYLENQFDSSVIFYKKSIETYLAVNDSSYIIMNQQNLAATYTKMGKLDEAKQLLFESLDFSMARKNNGDIGYALFSIAYYYQQISDNKNAAIYFEKAIPYFKKINDYVFVSNCHLGLSDMLYAMGKYKEAIENYKMMVQFRDSVFNEEQTRTMAQKEAQFNFQQQHFADSLKNVQRQKAMEIENREKLKRQEMFTWFSVGGLALMVLVALLLIRNNRNKTKANKIIELQKKEVEYKNLLIETRNKEITDSINYARRIQYSLLAHDALLNENLPEHFVLFMPKDIVSGDFYWATKAHDSFYLAVCDSTGHGVPGAFMSLLNISYLNEAIIEKSITEPHLVLNHVRTRLIENIEDSKDGMDGTLVRINKGRITYSSAHNKPIVIRNNVVVELNADKMPVGKSDHNRPFTLHEFIPEKGDVVYFYTDGYADQFGGPKGKKYKYSNLNQLLLNLALSEIKDQSVLLKQHFEEWKGELEQVDDVCVVGIRF
jgi:serine phosphatase RsbU (regulator of sigma subunit)